MRTTINVNNEYLFSEGEAKQLTIKEHSESEESMEGSYKKWLYYEVSRSVDIKELISDIRNGRAIAVSDGSYKKEWKKGTAAWRLESEKGNQYIQGTVISPGHPEMQSAYRSELVGQMAILDKMKEICIKYRITDGSILIGCDGITALQKANEGSPEFCSPNHKHSDILSAMNKINRSIPITINPVHVKGHQDDSCEYNELDRLAQINVDMDWKAKELLSQIYKDREINFEDYDLHPLSFQVIYVHNKPIYHRVKEEVHRHITEKKIIDHWIKKGRLTKETEEMVDWESNGRAMKSSTINRRRFVTKWGNEWLGTGKNMKKMENLAPWEMSILSPAG